MASDNPPSDDPGAAAVVADTADVAGETPVVDLTKASEASTATLLAADEAIIDSKDAIKEDPANIIDVKDSSPAVEEKGEKGDQGNELSVSQDIDQTVDLEQNNPDNKDEEGFVKYSTAVLVPLFIGLVSAHFLAALDATIVSTALGRIGLDFDATKQISWVATSYVLTFNAFQPLVGKFSQIFGHKIMTLVGVVIFMIGSAGCGASQTIIMLIVFRAIQGIGGAALLSMVLICISDMFPLKDRPKYLTVLWINFGVSTIIGPLLGGAFTDNLSWRWNFYINLPVGCIAFPLVYFFLNIPFKRQSFREQVARIDFLGTLLLIVAVILILIPTSLGGTYFAWDSGVVVGCFVGAAVFIAALIYSQIKIAKEPIIPPHLFLNRSVVAVLSTNFFQGASFFIFVFYGPLYFQVLKGDSATTSGLQLLPLLLGLVVFSIIGTVLLQWVKKYPPFIIIGSALITSGAYYFSTLDDSSTRGAEIGSMLLVGMGLGFSLQMCILAAQSAVVQSDTGTVSALAGFFQSIGGGIGLAILSAIFNNQIAAETDKLPPAIRDILTSGNSTGGSFSDLHKLPDEFLKPIIHVYVVGLQSVFRYATPFGAVAFLCSLFIRWEIKVMSPEEMANAGPSH